MREVVLFLKGFRYELTRSPRLLALMSMA
jgi:hypothetical protein